MGWRGVVMVGSMHVLACAVDRLLVRDASKRHVQGSAMHREA